MCTTFAQFHSRKFGKLLKRYYEKSETDRHFVNSQICILNKSKYQIIPQTNFYE